MTDRPIFREDERIRTAERHALVFGLIVGSLSTGGIFALFCCF